jgi:hypothetical protein
MLYNQQTMSAREEIKNELAMWWRMKGEIHQELSDRFGFRTTLEIMSGNTTDQDELSDIAAQRLTLEDAIREMEEREKSIAARITELTQQLNQTN